MPFSRHAGPALALSGLLGLALTVARPAQADTTVFSSFGPGGSFEQGASFTESGPNAAFVQNTSQGAEFTPSATGALSSVTVTYTYISGTDAAQLYLTDSFADLGHPAASLESFDFAPVVGNHDGTTFTLASASHPLLTAGRTYYLYGLDTGDEFNGFNLSSPVVDGTFIDNQGPNGTYEATPNQTLPAFSIQEASPAPAAVPEPSTFAPFALGAAGLLGLTLRARKRSKNKGT